MKPDAPISSASKLIHDGASRGRNDFSTEELSEELSVSLAAARSALRLLEKKVLVASPYRGFHVVVPPEHHRVGCLPAEQFVPQLMERLEVPYYAGLLTAARYTEQATNSPRSSRSSSPRIARPSSADRSTSPSSRATMRRRCRRQP